MGNDCSRRGELSQGSLINLLQKMGLHQSFNGFIDVYGFKQRGQIGLRKGIPIAAQWQDEVGEEALKSMVNLAHGRFELGESTAFPARNINRDLGVVLKECNEVTETVTVTPFPRHTAKWIKRLAVAAGLMALLGVGIFQAVERWHGWMKPDPVITGQQPPSVPVQSVKTIQNGWPVLSLSALMACGKVRACAILNGQIIESGGEVDGITVHSIRATGVLLEYQGQRRFMAMEKRVTL